MNNLEGFKFSELSEKNLEKNSIIVNDNKTILDDNEDYDSCVKSQENIDYDIKQEIDERDYYDKYCVKSQEKVENQEGNYFDESTSRSK